MTLMNPGSLVCVRCGGTPDEQKERYLGCSQCAAEGVPANFRWEADLDGVARCAGSTTSAGGMTRFVDALPVQDVVTLGEGGTPLTRLERLGAAYGLENLHVKNESVNPTWSHKDRLAAVAVTVARDRGAHVVAAASTGNHGAAVAAYAARAGLRCVVVGGPAMPSAMRELIVGYGADVVATPTSEGRGELIRAGAEQCGWYPVSNVVTPSVGSDPYGITGYKTIAYEIVEQLGKAPKWIVVPVGHGDCLAGVTRGFDELRAIGAITDVPRAVGIELYGVLGRAQLGGGLGPVATRDTAAFSISSSYATYQSLTALQASGGRACSVTEDGIAEARMSLARSEGLFVEAAAAATMAGVRTLAEQGVFGPADHVVCLLTSSAMKDPCAAGGNETRDIPMIQPNLAEFERALGVSGRRGDQRT